jgi:feruloyl esterase
LLAIAAQVLAIAGVAADCDGTTTYKIEGLTIQRASAIRPDPDYIVLQGQNGMPDLELTAPFCRIEATIDGSIGFELWLPDEWNGRFGSVGVGGYAGRIGVQGMAPLLQRGYAVSSTDTGHQGDGADFMSDAVALENYAYRGIHRTAEVSKHIITHYYGKQPDFAYFTGCSGGGYAGLANAQRYPGDYDGIISGAPGTLVTHHAARAMWVSALNAPGQTGRIPASKDALIPGAVTAACDADDGVSDGLIGDPLACEFDLESLACPKGEDKPSCLTTAQIKTAKQLYGPMLDAHGELIYPATAMGTPLPADALERRGAFYAQFWRTAVFEDQGWNPATFSVDDVSTADEKLRRFLDAGNADLGAFRAQGGKLILYHGWFDAGVSPLNTIDYYERLDSADGATNVQDYARLFLAPGMAHCSGGIGPDQFDTLTALEDWVERGEAPRRIIAEQYEGDSLVRSRPLCTYPEVAIYEGTGNTDAAESFSCGTAP